MDINLNDKVKFKRTPEVDALILHEYTEYWEANNPEYLEKYPKPYKLTIESDFHVMELWAFAATFGSYFHNGAAIPVELINIEIVNPKLEVF